MDKNIEKIQNLFRNEAFVKEFLGQESALDAQSFLEKHGIEMSVGEVESIGKIFEKIASGEISSEQIEKAANGELSEDDLEDVAGGLVLSTGALIAIIGGSIITGATTGAVLAAIFKW